ncbi:hypothetical protein DKX38_013207 [Salix brachista]|uniref:CASP-like protein n=1 Tax=Salix brachista TaxID=2182728 RepID=A0A5N5LQK0_9ROSI|nr:hypothetical protein DKX38_013207 [Salix brachista]
MVLFVKRPLFVTAYVIVDSYGNLSCLTCLRLPVISPCSCSYLIASMGLQVIWSFGLALLDAYALVKKKALHNTVMLSLFVVGDWVTAILSLAAASASAGVTVLYFHDLGNCDFVGECQKYQMSVALAFFSWITIAISSLIMLWLLAAG